jgi:hypothetical protein
MIGMPVKGMLRAIVLAVIKLQTCTTDGAGSEFPQTLRGQNLCLHGQKQLIMMRIAGHPGLCQVSSDRKKISPYNVILGRVPECSPKNGEQIK